MNFLLVLTIASFLIATVLSMDSAYGGGKSRLKRACDESKQCIKSRDSKPEIFITMLFFQSNYEAIPSEGDVSDTEGYRRRMRMRLRAKRLRMKALKRRLVKKAKKARKAKKVRRVVKKNRKH
ncbi:hypothetical protein Y032_0005g2622 [Ancylostoma ceylanicum]|uniref:Uncharacterized protein n=1 Tax=Ancylostoma ceylanicum TaxID=53326 RepID=A0A016VTK5_9BILA|nr:hypothetical protein Y032_0005g2622 [Ancylostoma ceylanicum]